jgi:hypothetical protein
MTPAMSPNEVRLFESALRCCDRYMEFGAGGSTVMAANTVRSSVISVDSSAKWLEEVQAACADLPLMPKLVHVDIGPVGPWGYPLDKATRDRWPSYHHQVWAVDGAADADLFLVDGRFRVACAMQIALHTRPDTMILVHDFADRMHYHVIREVLREVVRTERLSGFVPRAGQAGIRARTILEAYAYDAQ